MPAKFWIDELRAGRNDAALEILRKEKPSVGKFYRLGTAYMWIADFQGALDHFHRRIQKPLPYTGPCDLEYGMAGSAAWCLGEEKLAVKY